MGLNFRNSTSSTVYVAIGYLNYGCSPVTYAKIGWYRLFPGETRQVWSGYAGGRTFFYYAEDSFGRSWSGAYFTQVPNQAFHLCWNAGCFPCRNLGFRRIDISIFYRDYTVNLVSSSSRSSSKQGNILMALPSKQDMSKPKFRKMPTMARTKNLKKGTPVFANRMALPRKLKRKK